VRVIRRAVTALRNAFASPGARIFGLRFSRDYLRIAVRANARWGDRGAGTLRLLGFTIDYPNQAYALFLVHELFVNAEYAFTRTQARPRIVDCGANIGMSVAFFKAYAPDAVIVAIEADEAACAQLRQMIARNHLRDVEVVHAAVAETEGVVPFYRHPDDQGSITASVVAEWGGGSSRSVPAQRLSTFITEPIDFLKLDVEGAEYGVVDELAASGRLPLVREMVIECHDLAGSPGARVRLQDQLARAGMHVTVSRVEARSKIAIVRAQRPEA